jgi:transposase
MSGERLSMRKIREVLRLRLDQGLPQRAVAQSLGLSQGAVHRYVARARRAGLSWPLPEGLDDSQLAMRCCIRRHPLWRPTSDRFRTGRRSCGGQI